MPRRPSSFAKALQDAEKRLEKALVERKQSLDRVSALSVEIPNLEKTIRALKVQTGMIPEETVTYSQDLPPIPPTAIPGGMTPMELAKWYTERDLSAAGSIPAKQLTEDELLPEPDGTALTEE